MTPHTLHRPRWWNNWFMKHWWVIRGVTTPEAYIGLCSRCGYRGLAHWDGPWGKPDKKKRLCWRFKL